MSEVHDRRTDGLLEYRRRRAQWPDQLDDCRAALMWLVRVTWFLWMESKEWADEGILNQVTYGDSTGIPMG